MSGAKRRSGYRKGVTGSAFEEIQEPGEGLALARIVKPAGSNLFQVELAGAVGTGATEPTDLAAAAVAPQYGLALLPTKFRKLIWIKRGDAVLLATSAGQFSTASGEGSKVQYLVEAIINAESAKNLRATGQWPAGWDAAPAGGSSESAAAVTAMPIPLPADDARGHGGDGARESADESSTVAGAADSKEEDNEDGRGMHRRHGHRRGQGPRDLPPSEEEEGEEVP